MSDITLNIKGSQFLFGNTDFIDMTVAADMDLKDKKCVIKYTEEPDINTVITIDEDQVTLDRTGEDEARYFFKKSVPFMISYNTPYGNFGMNMLTTMVETDVNQEKGKIEIEYVMSLTGTQCVRKLLMTYKSFTMNKGI